MEYACYETRFGQDRLKRPNEA